MNVPCPLLNSHMCHPIKERTILFVLLDIVGIQATGGVYKFGRAKDNRATTREQWNWTQIHILILLFLAGRSAQSAAVNLACFICKIG